MACLYVIQSFNNSLPPPSHPHPISSRRQVPQTSSSRVRPTFSLALSVKSPQDIRSSPCCQRRFAPFSRLWLAGEGEYILSQAEWVHLWGEVTLAGSDVTASRDEISSVNMEQTAFSWGEMAKPGKERAGRWYGANCFLGRRCCEPSTQRRDSCSSKENPFNTTAGFPALNEKRPLNQRWCQMQLSVGLS